MIDINKLNELVNQKYVSVQKHPEADLYIYNYTQNAQYEAFWNNITLMCRGLILDREGNVVARPFSKFFNLEEHKSEEIPNENYEVFEKMDGSLGIMYWENDLPYIASRGSFTSEQAKWATNFLQKNFSQIFEKIDRTKTFLFEIIYSDNRIVVDYNDKEDLVLLAVLDTKTGKDEELPTHLGFNVVKKYDGINDFEKLKQYNADNFEGFVLKFKSGFRLKIKLEEYVRLHKIITNLSTIDIWESLSSGESFDHFLEIVPDEFFDWLKAKKKELENAYTEIETECKRSFKAFEDRKEAAEYFKTKKYSVILFKMRDGKKYDHIIWKLIKPKYQKAFGSKIQEN